VTVRLLLSSALAGGCCAAAAAAAGPPRPPVIHELFTLLPCPSSPSKRDSTIGIEGCREHTIVRSDGKINALAKAIFVQLGEPATRRRFIAAETAWFAYRQAFCESESDMFRGGSAAVDEFGACAVSANEQHVKDLTEFHKGLGPH
jgi:uncharacterized protein YecT (DUF1311 family)